MKTMTIYWRKKDIPALKGLSPSERTEAMKPVIAKVWRHWQVWLPFAIQIMSYIAFFLLAPQFPYRPFIVVAVVFVTAQLAALPFNHYVQHYLSQSEAKMPREKI